MTKMLVFDIYEEQTECPFDSNDHFQLGLTYVLFYSKEPSQVDGKGDYALTDVYEMIGTKEFLGFPKEVRKCQNEESILECRSDKSLDTGKNMCKCTPHHLRNLYRTVSQFQITFLDFINYSIYVKSRLIMICLNVVFVL